MPVLSLHIESTDSMIQQLHSSHNSTELRPLLQQIFQDLEFAPTSFSSSMANQSHPAKHNVDYSPDNKIWFAITVYSGAFKAWPLYRNFYTAHIILAAHHESHDHNVVYDVTSWPHPHLCRETWHRKYWNILNANNIVLLIQQIPVLIVTI